jgi:L-fucose mutarotase
MLKSQLIHPQILAALARSGHSSRVLISDGNYPHSTRRGPNAELVYLNLTPGVVGATEVLRALVGAIPIEAAAVMDYARTGPYALKEEPAIWSEFRSVFSEAKMEMPLQLIERFAFYDAASTPDVCLTIATAEQRIYANLLLTIGVVN